MSKKPTIKLKNCPCCGDSPHWRKRTEERFLFAHTTRSDLWRVCCGDCGMSSLWSDNEHFAAEGWNRRDRTEAIEGALRNLFAMVQGECRHCFATIIITI